jgi:hypothetical protein
VIRARLGNGIKTIGRHNDKICKKLAAKRVPKKKMDAKRMVAINTLIAIIIAGNTSMHSYQLKPSKML